MQGVPIRLILTLAFFFMASCASAPPPQQVGLEFWKKRTMLDPAAAQYVQKQLMEQG